MRLKTMLGLARLSMEILTGIVLTGSLIMTFTSSGLANQPCLVLRHVGGQGSAADGVGDGGSFPFGGDRSVRGRAGAALEASWETH